MNPIPKYTFTHHKHKPIKSSQFEFFCVANINSIDCENDGDRVNWYLTHTSTSVSLQNHDKKMRQKLCRNAMTRSNKTCEMNATKNGPKKRSEKQHAKNASRANNNRSKC